MSTRIVQKEYPSATYYADLVADFTEYFAWDEVDDTTTENATIFKKYYDTTTGAYTGLKLINSGAIPIRPVHFNGVTLYEQSFDAIGSYTWTVIRDDSFVFMRSTTAARDSRANIQVCGFAPSKNLLDGASGYSGFCIYNGTCNVYGKSQLNTNVLSFNTPTGSNSPRASTITIPLVGGSDDVIDSILLMLRLPDTFLNTVEATMYYNNKEYIRLGIVLVEKEA